MSIDKNYIRWISELKQKIRSAQIKAAVAINRELILFYQKNTSAVLIRQELVTQILWGHTILIFTKTHDFKEACFYIQKIKETHWGKRI